MVTHWYGLERHPLGVAKSYLDLHSRGDALQRDRFDGILFPRYSVTSSSCPLSRAISRGVGPFVAAAFSVHTIIFHQTFDNVQVTTGTSESFSFLFHTTHFLSNILPPRSNHFSIAPCTLGTSFSMAVFRVGIKKHTHILPPSI